MRRALRDPIIIAIAVVGIVLTAGVALLVRNNQQRQAEQWLEERAELIVGATEDTVTHTFHDLEAVAAFLNSSDTTTQRQFARFVEQIDIDTGVIGIGYVQIVDDSNLEQFLAEAREDLSGFGLLSFDGEGGIGPTNSTGRDSYPLRYVSGGPFLDLVIARTPIGSGEDALGFDVATEPLWSPAFEKAATLSTPSVSELLELGGDFAEHAFTVSHPIFTHTGELEGLLIAPGLESLLTADLGFSITSNVAWSVDSGPRDAQAVGWPVWQRTLDLPGSTWLLTVSPTDETLADLSPKRDWVIVLVGFGLTGLLATTTYQMRLRRREQDELEQLQ